MAALAEVGEKFFWAELFEAFHGDAVNVLPVRQHRDVCILGRRGQNPIIVGAGDTYFFISPSSMLASMCMSIPAHTSFGDLALG